MNFLTNMRRAASKQRGFTMVELAIVLVVAGLILVAVLKGTDTIDKAKAERAVADLRGLQGMIMEYQKRTGRLPGDCDNNGRIEYLPVISVSGASATAGHFLDAIEIDRILPPAAVNGPTDPTANCATSANTSEANINTVWNELRRNNIVDPQRLPVELAKNPNGSFYSVGNMTDGDGAGATPPSLTNANVIVVYNIPIWLAEAIDASIDGVVNYTGSAAAIASAPANTGRIRRWDNSMATLTGAQAFYRQSYLNGFAKDNTETRDSLIAISFQFDVNKLPN